MKKNNLTQAQLAEIAGMTQANVSKALNPTASKQFTIDQVYRISQHFGVSIDELLANKVAEKNLLSPATVLSYLVKLLCNAKVRTTTITEEEHIYHQITNDHGFPDCEIEKVNVQYNAFYFPDYFDVHDFAFNEIDLEDTHWEFEAGGNDTKFQYFNEILNKLLPIIKLYRAKDIPEDAFNMILNGYLEQLS